MIRTEYRVTSFRCGSCGEKMLFKCGPASGWNVHEDRRFHCNGRRFFGPTTHSKPFLLPDDADPKEPTPPENVRLVRSDGRSIPLDCVYSGYRDGIHVWEAIVHGGFSLRNGDEVRVDTLPGHTSIRLKMSEAGES